MGAYTLNAQSDFIRRADYPNIFPLSCKCDSVHIFGQGDLIIRYVGDKVQLQEVPVFNRNKKGFSMRSSNLMTIEQAKNRLRNQKLAIENRRVDQERVLQQINRDTFALRAINQFLAQDELIPPGTGQ